MVVSDVVVADTVGTVRPTFGSAPFQVANDNTITVTTGGIAHAVAHGVFIKTGSYFFETTIVALNNDHGVLVVGWADGKFTGESSYVTTQAVDSTTTCRWGFSVCDGTAIAVAESRDNDGDGDGDGEGELHASVQQQSFARPCYCGDTIGCLLDFAAATITYSINGEVVGNLPVAVQCSPDGSGLIPCVSVGHGCQARVNFGAQQLSPWSSTLLTSSAKAQHRLVQDHVCELQETLVAQSCGGRYGKLVPTSGSTGLVITDFTVTFQNGFPSCKLAGVLLTRGRWYYEVKILKAGQAVQLGWCDLEFHGSSATGIGVGDDKASWAFDGVRAPGQGSWHTSPYVYVCYGITIKQIIAFFF